ncbi:hypothetical protein GGI21_003986 [Coemansia aciculifera]|nr:hypothetical protein GGI21_003986 [Coemansia aciculifera]
MTVFDIKDKVAVVTGGAQSIGLLVVQDLVKRGARVIVGDINTAGAAECKRINKESKAIVAVFNICDVSDMDSLKSLIDLAITTFGRLDILVNNAGIEGKPWVFDATGDAAHRCVMTNVCSVIGGTNHALHYWNKEEREGVVVNNASLAAYLPLDFLATYAATKAAVVMYTKCMASMAPKVRVNAVASGFADTKLVTENKYLGRDHWAVKASGLIPPQIVADQIMRAIEDNSLAGDVIIVKNNEEPVLCTLPKSTELEAPFRKPEPAAST